MQLLEVMMMMLGTMGTVVAACFCLGPTVLPESVPVAPDAAVIEDGIPQACLVHATGWAHHGTECPLMPAADPLFRLSPRPLLLFRVR